MENIQLVADQVEEILQRVMRDANSVAPTPDRYFMFGDRNQDSHWIFQQAAVNRGLFSFGGLASTGSKTSAVL